MSRDKQIEEMAECLIDIQRNFNEYCAKPCRECELGGIVNCENHYKAEALYNAGYRKQSAWISVEDRLPEVDKNVLVITAHGSFKIARCNIYKNGTQVVWATNDGLGERAIAHWMPLPQPPEMKGGAE